MGIALDEADIRKTAGIVRQLSDDVKVRSEQLRWRKSGAAPLMGILLERLPSLVPFQPGCAWLSPLPSGPAGEHLPAGTSAELRRSNRRS
ncbi:MAG: hypothetical protein E5V57_01405 [Mesorhizobium sp.]|nr:MAG: hypothetical protein E5V57_01405 [Mesorhizobium sp.]